MTDYTPIGSGELVADQPITESMMTRLRDNPLAIFERSAGAPTYGATVDSSGTNANGHYRVWSDGFIEQWFKALHNSSGIIHTFPVAFATLSTLRVTGGILQFAGNPASPVNITGLTTTTVTVMSQSASDGTDILVAGF